MMKVFLVIFLVFQSTSAFADARDDIRSCMAKIKEFTNLSPDPLEAKYTSHWTSPDEVFWLKEGIFCTTTLDQVRSLSVNGEVLITEFFAGEDARNLYKKLDHATDAEIERLESRLEKARIMLMSKDPNLSEIEEFILRGISHGKGVDKPKG